MRFGLTGRLLPVFVYVFLFVAPFLVYWPLWIHPQAMALDMADYFLPIRYFIGESLQQHQFPWWNPYSGLGVPLAADPQSGVYYPFTWIIGYLSGYDFFTISIEYLLHLVIAGWGMYLLLRGLKYPVIACLLLALSYQFCGFFVNNAEHLSWVISAAWLPWFFHFYRKVFLDGNWPDAIKTSLSLFMITTGGYPAFVIILLYIVSGHYLFFLIRNMMDKNREAILQSMKWSAIILVIYLVIAAPFIFSFLQGVPLMTRGDALIKGHTLFRAFTPGCTVTFLLPAAVQSNPDDFNTDSSMANAYVGLAALIFFVTGIIRSRTYFTRCIALLSLLFLLISFGDAFPLWPFVFDHLPFFDHIRFPAAFRLFVIMGILLVAAEGIKMESLKRSMIPAFVTAAILLLVGTIAAIAYIRQKDLLLPVSFSTEGMQKFFGDSNTANTIVLQSLPQTLILIGLLFMMFTATRWMKSVWYSVLLLICLTDLFIASRINFPSIIVSSISATTMNNKLAAMPKGFPMPDPTNERETTNIGNGSFAPSYFNNNLFYKRFSTDSYIPFVLKTRSNLERSPKKNVLMDHPVSYLTNQVQSYPDLPSDSIHLNTPLSILVPDSILSQLTTAGTDSLNAIAKITSFSINKFGLNAITSQSSVLVLQQNYYPGWKAMVDGKPVVPFLSNYCMMSVLLNAGEHEVIFYYDTNLLHRIMIVSTFMLLSAVLYLFLNWSMTMYVSHKVR